jgi:predicted O-methyltransferase YrrM
MANLNFAEMYNWTYDLPAGSKIIFTNVLSLFLNKKANVLEIGTFAGTSLISILTMLPDAKGTAIDIWSEEKSADDDLELLLVDNNIKMSEVEKIFHQNIKTANMTDRIEIFKGDSKHILMNLLKSNKKYDIIYVDGSHTCLDTYHDAILAWEILEKNGVLIFDDYLWGNNLPDLDKPMKAVDQFLNVYKGQYTLLDKGYRVFIYKL